MTSLRRPRGRAALGALALFALALVLRPLLTQSMALHMLVHIPMFVIAGALALPVVHVRRAGCSADTGGAQPAPWLAGFDQYGVSGLLYASLTGMYWMIPKALDGVLLSGSAELCKVLSLLLAGLCLRASWARAHRVIKLFFVGGFCWATAIVGLLYQESPQRLCNFYLLDDQTWTGRGLVILAVVIPLAWLYAEVAAHRRCSGDYAPAHSTQDATTQTSEQI